MNIELISLIFNGLLGGSWIATIVTLRSKIKSAAAEARADELKNVESAIKIWRDIAENMTEKYSEVSLKCDTLNTNMSRLSHEVNRLRLSNNKIVKLLDKITPENLEKVVSEIKNELNQIEE